jgi:hypothetical protein
LLVRLLIVLVVGTAILLPVSSGRADAAGCQFVLGFKALHDLIPDLVGDCLVDEHHNPTNGDGLQETTAWHGHGGLLVWRKSDNWTAFTDGASTWVNGPYGLQKRANGQRLFWEANPDRLPIVPPPAAGERCHTAGLSLSLQGVDAGAGNRFATLLFTNNAGVSCTFYGFPGARMLDASSNPLPTVVVRNGGQLGGQPGPTLVTVPAGGSARFLLHWGVVPVGSETTCPTSSQLQVTPPDEFVSLVIPIQIDACGGGRLDVSAVQSAN